MIFQAETVHLEMGKTHCELYLSGLWDNALLKRKCKALHAYGGAALPLIAVG
jgi:hypothetical protein